MLKVVACLLVVVTAIGGHLQSANGLAQLRTRRVPASVPAVVVTPAPTETESDGVTVTDDEPATVMAEIKSEADETGEDGSNDDSGAQDTENSQTSVPPIAMVEAEIIEPSATSLESIHDHFRQFTKPMELLPVHSLAEVKAGTESATSTESRVREDDEEGEGKGSNPTYILPVDPFNYFPFFNGFSNVNPFSQFYPPPPYLYPQYTNYMHRYANNGVGHPPAYPQPGAYGGAVGNHAYGHGSFPYNYPHPNPHMHYPFGAYKLDVSGPDVRTGTNSPPPFPQFSEMSSHIKLITPEIIPKTDAETEEDAAPLTAQLETSAGETDSDESSDEVEIADEAEDGSEMTDEIEFNDEAGDSDQMADDVEFKDEAEDSDGMTDAIEFEEDQENVDSTQDEEGNVYNSYDVEYQS